MTQWGRRNAFARVRRVGTRCHCSLSGPIERRSTTWRRSTRRATRSRTRRRRSRSTTWDHRRRCPHQLRATRRPSGRGPAAEDEGEGVRGRDADPAGRAGGDAGVGQGHRSQDLRRVRGSGFRRQGRHDQADHRADEPARVQAHRPAHADRAGEVADVRAALHRSLPGGRRGRDLRPQLVQPGRRRAGVGVLHS